MCLNIYVDDVNASMSSFELEAFVPWSRECTIRNELSYWSVCYIIVCRIQIGTSAFHNSYED